MTDSRYTFPVIENHPAMGVSLCPMCGGEVDYHGDCPQDNSIDATEALQALRVMARWALHKPLHLKVLAARIEFPERSIRGTAMLVGVERSRVCEVLADLEGAMPGLSRMLGVDKPASIAQQQRRRREKHKTEAGK